MPNMKTMMFSYDEETKEIHAICGKFFYSVQFHPESILSPRGYDFIKEILLHIINRN